MLLFCQVLFKDGVFQWKRLENLIILAKENVAKMSSNPALQVKNVYVSHHKSLVHLVLDSGKRFKNQQLRKVITSFYF